MLISRIVPCALLFQRSLQAETKPLMLSAGDPHYDLEKNMIVCAWRHELNVPLSAAIELTNESASIATVRDHAKSFDMAVDDLKAYLECLRQDGPLSGTTIEKSAKQ
jgi:hypothetical protein